MANCTNFLPKKGGLLCKVHNAPGRRLPLEGERHGKLGRKATFPNGAVVAVGKYPLAVTIAVLDVPTLDTLDPAVEIVAVATGENLARGDVVCDMNSVVHRLFSLAVGRYPFTVYIISQIKSNCNSQNAQTFCVFLVQFAQGRPGTWRRLPKKGLAVN